jgi:hypothetical protein
MMDAVHKRIHAAQAEEFGLLKREFKKDPAALWRGNKRSRVAATLDFSPMQPDVDPAKLSRFTAALEDADMVPAADPNTPSEMHRLMKAQALILLMQMSQQMPDGRLDPRRVIEYTLRQMRVNLDMFAPPPDPDTPPPPDPKIQAAQIQADSQQTKVQIAGIQSQDKLREIQSKRDLAQMDLQRDVIAHHTAVTQAQPQQTPPAPPVDAYAEGGLVDKTHELTMARHDLEMQAQKSADAERERRSTHMRSMVDFMNDERARQDARHERQAQFDMANADIVKALIAHKTKELEIEKSKLDAKKPKPTTGTKK